MKTCCHEKGYSSAPSALMQDDSVPRFFATRMHRRSSSRFEKRSRILVIGIALNSVVYVTCLNQIDQNQFGEVCDLENKNCVHNRGTRSLSRVTARAGRYPRTS